jgi:hypothetical protein
MLNLDKNDFVIPVCISSVPAQWKKRLTTPIYIYMHTYVRTCIRTYIHTCILRGLKIKDAKSYYIPTYIWSRRVLYGLFMYTNRDFQCRMQQPHPTRTKKRILPIFCAVLDAAVASDTENHIHVNRPLSINIGNSCLWQQQFIHMRSLAPFFKKRNM